MCILLGKAFYRVGLCVYGITKISNINSGAIFAITVKYVYINQETKGFVLTGNHHKLALSASHMNTYVMGLLPLSLVRFVQRGERL